MNHEFLDRLQKAWPDLPQETAHRIDQFRECVVEENEQQNLTRLISPQEFVEGHVMDVKELLKSGFLDYPAMDLGSGVGVPGLLCALIQPEAWVLAESEGHKADFLSRTVQKLGLDRVQVVAGRAETYLKKNTVRSVVARAVGPVDRIYGWLENCSTWNTLLLLKGPRWTTEWGEFQKSRKKCPLGVTGQHEYAVGSENKQRIIVRLQRVPRGTF